MENFQKIKDYLVSKNIQFREISHDKGATAEEYHQALGCTYSSFLGQEEIYMSAGSAFKTIIMSIKDLVQLEQPIEV